ncbi:MAG: type II toxin-antitoxin system Phd/YefM family antitoxin [Chloroflexota bacterium]
MTKTKRVSAAQAKAHFSSLVAEVAFAGQRIVIERRGKPMAALVSIADLEQLQHDQSSTVQPKGALALVGVWSDVPDEMIDVMVADIYESRDKDKGRPVTLEL